MDFYYQNSQFFGWGNHDEPLNLEKIALLDRYAKGKILDVGCASGRYTQYLFQKGYHIEGVDTSSKLISKAKKLNPNIAFHHASAYNLPFPNSSFDTIILFDILEHLNDQKALNEVRRVGKRVIISVPHQNQDLLLKYSLAHHHYLDRTHQRAYTTQSLSKLLHNRFHDICCCHTPKITHLNFRLQNNP